MTLESFARQQYINVETFRKNGVGVKTPVWFIEKDGKIFTRTELTSGKVKRLRNNPRVRIVPSKMDGAPTGEWLDATARLVTDPQQADEIVRLYHKKYGLMAVVFFKIMGSLRKAKYAIIEFSLN